jgi:hypothetical protein
MYVFRLFDSFICAGSIEEQIHLRQVYKSQLAQLALHSNEKQKRYFKGIQGMRNEQGELFGVNNLVLI